MELHRLFPQSPAPALMPCETFITYMCISSILYLFQSTFQLLYYTQMVLRKSKSLICYINLAGIGRLRGFVDQNSGVIIFILIISCLIRIRFVPLFKSTLKIIPYYYVK